MNFGERFKAFTVHTDVQRGGGTPTAKKYYQINVNLSLNNVIIVNLSKSLLCWLGIIDV